jgi:hypothetical protein
MEGSVGTCELPGDYTDENGRIVMPLPLPAELPGWIVHGSRRKNNFGSEDLLHGTVVIIDKIDKLKPSTLTGSSAQFKSILA